VFKQICPTFHPAAVVLLTLFTTAVFEQSPKAQTTVGAWTPVDIGSPLVRGSAQQGTCTATTGCPLFTINGSGLGITGASDQFMFLHQRLTGDGSVTVRLLSLTGTATTEAGIMIRESLLPSSRHVSLLASPTGFSVRTRTATSGATSSQAVTPGSWLRLERAGGVVKASVSADGAQWTVKATQSVTLPLAVYVGIAVTSRSSSGLGTATMSNMAVTATSPSLPSGWSGADVGPASSPGTVSYALGSFLATSYGAGFTGASDGFRFVHTRVRGDATMSVRVAELAGASGRQAGLVLRSTLDGAADEVAILADPAGIVVVRRAAVGQTITKQRYATALVPVYLRLERRGTQVTAAYSTSGTTWITVAILTAGFPTDFYAGLAVASGTSGAIGAATFDRLSLVSIAANQPPLVSLTSPSSGAAVTTGQTVALSATASDPDDVVTRVEFKVNGVTLGSDTTAPYAASWTAATAGTYSVVATAWDYDGASKTSSAALVTVASSTTQSGTTSGTTAPPPGTWRLQFDASSDHARLSKYVLDVYTSVVRVKVLTKDLGKPAPSATGLITVDVNTLISALPIGLFDAVVRAVATDGETPSVPYSFSK
jgi:regulation of enolase protein 1 (concanavalin A-like superfamily)